MKSTFAWAAAAMAAAVLAAVPAAADEDDYTASGVIDHVDTASDQLYLTDGRFFSFDEGTDTAALSGGSQVFLHWMPVNGSLKIDELSVY